MDSPALLLDHATARFDDVVALDGISMQLPSGALVGVIGPSGSGKTTAIRLLTGGLAPTEGQVRVLGEDPRAFRRSTRRRIGYMPQHFSLYPDLTAQENVDFVASMFGMLLPSRRRRVPEILKLVDLWDARSRRAGHLSGGMQRRLELAATLVHEPVLLFLDEPTAGIDPLLRAIVWRELKRLREAGRTVLVTTQYVTEAEECELVALIAEGRLVALGTPDELRRQAAGGEHVEIRTTRPVSPREWADLPDATAVNIIGDSRLRVTVPSAATAIPVLVEAIRATGNEVTEALERRPSFDDVFAALVGAGRVDGAGIDGEPPEALPGGDVVHPGIAGQAAAAGEPAPMDGDPAAGTAAGPIAAPDGGLAGRPDESPARSEDAA